MPTDLTKFQQQGEKAKQGNYVDTPYFKEQDGRNQIRILPGYPHTADTVPSIEFKKVFVRSRQIGFVPRAQFKLACPWEAFKNNLDKLSDDAGKKQRDDYQLRGRVAFIVIDRADEAAGPKVWETNGQNLSAISALTADPQIGDICDPNKGLDIVIDYKKGVPNKSFPEWNIRTALSKGPIVVDAKIQEEWLSKNWFQEYHVGEPSEEGWINAVLTDTVDAYKEARKKEKGNNAPSGATEATRDSLPASNAGTATTQAPASATPMQVGQAPWEEAITPCPLTTPWWLNDGGQAVQVDAAKVSALVVAGGDPQVCSVSNPTAGWKLATEYGFKRPAPKPVAPPLPSAPALPQGPPPVPNAATSVPNGNVVSQELRSVLTGIAG